MPNLHEKEIAEITRNLPSEGESHGIKWKLIPCSGMFDVTVRAIDSKRVTREEWSAREIAGVLFGRMNAGVEHG